MSAFGGSQEIGAYHLALGAENGPALRALEQLKAAADRTFQGLDRGSRTMMDSLGSFATSLAGITGVMIAVGGAAAGVFGVMSAAVEANDRAMRSLQRSVQGTLDLDAWRGFADQLSDFTSRSENDITRLAATIASLSTTSNSPGRALSGDALESATAAAVGLAAKYEHLGLSAERAARLVAGAFTGDFSGLESLGMTFDPSADGAAKYAQVLRIGITEGLREADHEAATLGGGLRRLKFELTNLLASAGTALSIGANGGEILRSLAEAVERLSAKVAGMKPLIDQLRESFLSLAGVDSFDDFLNFDVMQIELARIFDYLKSEITILGAYLQDTLASVVNNIVTSMPEWMFDETPLTPAIKSHRQLTIEGQLSEREMVMGQWQAAVGTYGLDPSYEARARAELAIVERQVETLRKALFAEKLKSRSVMDRIDVAGFAEKERAAQQARDEQHRNDLFWSTFDFGDFMLDLGKRLNMFGSNFSALETFQNTLNDSPVPPGAGIDDAVNGRANRIQSAIGELAIPGIDTTKSLMEEQRKLQKSMDGRLASLVKAAQQRRYRV